jgi:nudix-type nucleoside diphosphatase (YffH/AdpP family)
MPAPESTIYNHQTHVRVAEERVLSHHWYTLKTTAFDLLRRDGNWQRQHRETYDRGNGACILLVNPAMGTVILTRQFRYPTFVNGNTSGYMVEACAGLLDKDDPETCIRRETEEETGYRVGPVRKIRECYMSPGSVTEKLHFFIAEYSAKDQVNAGGGHAHEGEDIEVLELPFAEALAMVADGRIEDAKTILLLQHAALEGLVSPARAPAPQTR